MATIAVFGSTGLTGHHVLETLLAADWVGAVQTISRRAPKTPEGEQAKLHAVVDADVLKWPGLLSKLSPAPSTVISSLGTTRAAAGGIANQWKIDHDANVEIAYAAKAAGTRTFVFVSSGGTRGFLSRRVPYSRMKIGVEDTVRDLEFDHAVVLRPGLILGQREKGKEKAPWLEYMLSGVAKISQGAADTVGVDARIIARAAVAAARLAEEGKAPSKYWVLEQADVLRLGRDEWGVQRWSGKPVLPEGPGGT